MRKFIIAAFAAAVIFAGVTAIEANPNSVPHQVAAVVDVGEAPTVEAWGIGYYTGYWYGLPFVCSSPSGVPNSIYHRIIGKFTNQGSVVFRYGPWVHGNQQSCAFGPTFWSISRGQIQTG